MKRRKCSGQAHACTYKEALEHNAAQHASPSPTSTPAGRGNRGRASIDWDAATPSPKNSSARRQALQTLGTGSPHAHRSHGKDRSHACMTCPVFSMKATSCVRRLSLASPYDKQSPTRQNHVNIVRKVATPLSASKALDAQVRRRRALRLLQQWKDILSGEVGF